MHSGELQKTTHVGMLSQMVTTSRISESDPVVDNEPKPLVCTAMGGSVDGKASDSSSDEAMAALASPSRPPAATSSGVKPSALLLSTGLSVLTTAN